MAHDVFVSYSSKDKAVADAVCAKLESQKVRCWIAPRDVPAGQTWAAAIVNAIRTSRALVLVLSAGSNNSAQVVRESEKQSTMPSQSSRFASKMLSLPMKCAITSNRSTGWMP